MPIEIVINLLICLLAAGVVKQLSRYVGPIESQVLENSHDHKSGLTQ